MQKKHKEGVEVFGPEREEALVLEVSKPCLYQDSHFSSLNIAIF